ncbi:hypothetical protein BASA62_008321 [Batrachochytrium salamandrivorans]|nr:hypothetical protein BASA62_008321 [Batrachochytrium salamandrivorans]
MRVGTGIILSLLSSSALAAVISNDDSHGLLLVRRTVNLKTVSLLVSKNNDEQVEFVPSNSGAGASTETSNDENNPNYSSGNRGSSKPGRFREFFNGLYRSLKKSFKTPRQKYTRWRDKNVDQKSR